MKHLEQFDLPCKTDCPFILRGLRQCGTGYKNQIVPTTLAGIGKTVDVLVPTREICHENITEIINSVDEIRPSNAYMTDGNSTLPFILTISYFTESGLLPIGGINDGTFYPIDQQSHSITGYVSTN